MLPSVDQMKEFTFNVEAVVSRLNRFDQDKALNILRPLLSPEEIAKKRLGEADSRLAEILLPIEFDIDNKSLSRRLAKLALMITLLSSGNGNKVIYHLLSLVNMLGKEGTVTDKMNFLWTVVFESIIDMYSNEYPSFTQQEKASFVLVAIHFLKRLDSYYFNQIIDGMAERADTFLKNFAFEVMLPGA
ncbi:MAG: hypothetical protein NZ480_05375 [Bdellovibrionaceae bacterium]|nr:hypothetical protein [Pseudobdellovibrionaceae bacterium]MDW8190404.1 hypothetical protein [Pseudobdellovibrionaceae bacterium]